MNTTELTKELEANVLAVDNWNEQQFYDAARDLDSIHHFLLGVAGEPLSDYSEDDIKDSFYDLLDDMTPPVQLLGSEFSGSDLFKNLYNENDQNYFISDYTDGSYQEITEGCYVSQDDYNEFLEGKDLEEVKKAFLWATDLEAEYEAASTKVMIEEALNDQMAPQEVYETEASNHEAKAYEAPARQKRAM